MKPVLAHLDDGELLLKVKTGDHRAFSELVKRYEKLVYGFSYKLCRDKDKAEESFQDTFINVYRKIDQFDGRSKLSTWLYSIVANNCLMKHRKRKIDEGMESFDDPPEGGNGDAERNFRSWDDTPVDKIMKSELKARLDDAIQKLPKEYQVVFLLRDVEHQTAEETAKILKLSVPAVKSRLRRARIFLRQELHEYMIS